MAYTVDFSHRAAREFAKLPASIKSRIGARIDGLADDPRPPGVKELSGTEHLYRLRVGDHRVLHHCRDDILVVLVVGVGHRRDVYRRLPPDQ